MEVNDIWLVDDTHHGVSVSLNAGRLNDKVTWDDGARNLLNLIKHVIPAYPSGGSWQLDWHESPGSVPVIGVGHSIGGNNVVLAALSEPECFTGAFLVEPMCTPKAWEHRQAMALTTLKRRDIWPSLSAAAEMRQSPLCKSWSDEVFDLWLRCSLVSHPNGVQLSTPRWCEATCFATPTAPQRAWDALEQLSVPVGFIMAAETRWMGGERAAHEMVQRPRRGRHEVMEAGHLIVQERPEELGQALGRFLATLPRWEQEDARL